MASLELAAALHEAAPHLPVVLATKSTEEIGADTLMNAGIADVVHWPIVAAERANGERALSSRCLTVVDTTHALYSGSLSALRCSAMLRRCASRRVRPGGTPPNPLGVPFDSVLTL